MLFMVSLLSSAPQASGACTAGSSQNSYFRMHMSSCRTRDCSSKVLTRSTHLEEHCGKKCWPRHPHWGPLRLAATQDPSSRWVNRAAVSCPCIRRRSCSTWVRWVQNCAHVAAEQGTRRHGKNSVGASWLAYVRQFAPCICKRKTKWLGPSPAGAAGAGVTGLGLAGRSSCLLVQVRICDEAHEAANRTR